MNAPADPRRRLDRRIDEQLETGERAGARRQLRPGAGVDFASNDFLGLARDPRFRAEVAQRVVAASAAGETLFVPASRHVRGQTLAHARIEARLAALRNTERALVFPSAWQATVALLGTLPRAGDIVLSDEWNHATLIDGVRASRAERIVVPHQRIEAWARELDRPRGGSEVFVVVEARFALEGDEAPLAELAALCRKFDAHLIVDETHTFGIAGARGSGWAEVCGVERELAAAIVPFEAALACPGAAIAGSRRLIELLVQRARPFVFGTAASPLALLAVEAALDLVLREPARRARLDANSKRLRQRLAANDPLILPEGGPIVPILIGDAERAQRASRALELAGFDVPALVHPMAPENGARLRVAVHADHGDAQLDQLASALERFAPAH